MYTLYIHYIHSYNFEAIAEDSNFCFHKRPSDKVFGLKRTYHADEKVNEMIKSSSHHTIEGNLQFTHSPVILALHGGEGRALLSFCSLQSLQHSITWKRKPCWETWYKENGRVPLNTIGNRAERSKSFYLVVEEEPCSFHSCLCCSHLRYSIMKCCWHWSEDSRPLPGELCLRLEAASRSANDKAVLQVPELVVPELYADVAGIRAENLSYSYSVLWRCPQTRDYMYLE